jgi:hypothetical protein
MGTKQRKGNFIFLAHNILKIVYAFTFEEIINLFFLPGRILRGIKIFLPLFS